MIHLVIREPLAYQRTLCRALSDTFEGEFVAWFGEPVGLETRPACRDFSHQFLADVGYTRLFRELSQDRHAVVILGGWSSAMARKTLLIAKLLRRPIFIWTDHPHPRPRTRAFRFLRKIYLRLLARVVTGFLACGEPTVRHLEEMGIASARITNFPYWAEVPNEWSLPNGCEESSNRQPLRLLAVGRLVPVKQFNVAIEAVAEANRQAGVELLIAGDGPERARLEALSESLACNGVVHFKGWLANTDVLREIEQADALVLASSFDAYGVVVLEAMARGRPVLASDGVIAAIDRHEGQAVFFHKPGDSKALATQIQALAQDREFLRRAAADARAIAEKWPPSRAGILINQLLQAHKIGIELVPTIETGGTRVITSG